MSTDKKDRIMSLLADRATQGLSQEELSELKELLQKYPQWDNPYFDLTAAAVNLTDIEIDEPLPDELRQRIMANAFQYANSTQAETEQERNAQERIISKLQKVNKENAGKDTVIKFPQKSARLQMMGWYVAAACLLLAVLGWWPRLTQKAESANLSELRQKLLAESRDVIKTDWKPLNYQNAERISGDVVWSNAKQQGFMRFTGMPVIDPKVGEYQLWIFDANQDEKFPVDGGVFEVNQQTGEVIIRINAKLKVSQPTLFAVTIEKPGGVVVSKRDSIVAVAKVD
jgi:hypothetical protein